LGKKLSKKNILIYLAFGGSFEEIVSENRCDFRFKWYLLEVKQALATPSLIHIFDEHPSTFLIACDQLIRGLESRDLSKPFGVLGKLQIASWQLPL